MFLVVAGFEPFGGLEEYVTSLAEALRTAGTSVSVFSARAVSPGNQYAKRLEVAEVPLSQPGGGGKAAPGPRKGRLLVRVPRALRRRTRMDAVFGGRYPSVNAELRGLLYRLDAALDRDGPAVVHVHGALLYPADIVPWMVRRGVGVVYSEHNNIAEHPAGYTPERPAMARRAHVLTADSTEARDSLAAATGAKRVEVLDMMTSSPPPASPEDRDGATVAALLRLEPAKGVDILLRAFASVVETVPGAKLVIAGDGPGRSALIALRSELGLDGRVEFAGSIDRSQVFDLLARANLLVHPSLSEANPLVVSEAMAAGRAVVATAVGGVPTVVRHGRDGVLVPPGDVRALAEATTRLLRDPDTRLSMAANGRAAWERGHHDPAAAARAVLDLYAEAGAVAPGLRRRPRRRLLRAPVRASIDDVLLFTGLFATALLPGPVWPLACGRMARIATGKAQRGRTHAAWTSRYAPHNRTAVKAMEYEERVRFIREWLTVLPGMRTRLEARQPLDEALRAGNGVVIWVGLSADSFLGSKKALAQHGVRATHLSRPEHGFFLSKAGRFLNRPQLASETRYLGDRLLLGEGNAPGALLGLAKALRSGGVVTITFDTNALRPLRRPFLDGTLCVPPGPIKLAASTGAVLLPAFTTSQAGTVVTTVGDPIRVDEGIEAAADQYLDQLRPWVERDPLRWAGVLARMQPPGPESAAR